VPSHRVASRRHIEAAPEQVIPFLARRTWAIQQIPLRLGRVASTQDLLVRPLQAELRSALVVAIPSRGERTPALPLILPCRKEINRKSLSTESRRKSCCCGTRSGKIMANTARPSVRCSARDHE
jgi:hypothetical protein